MKNQEGFAHVIPFDEHIEFSAAGFSCLNIAFVFFYYTSIWLRPYPFNIALLFAKRASPLTRADRDIRSMLGFGPSMVSQLYYAYATSNSSFPG